MLLEADQLEKREAARTYFEDAGSIETKREQAALAENARKRSKRMLEILDEVGQPSLTNIGTDAAIAVSVLATHSSLSTMHKILTAFSNCYNQESENTHYQSIPALTDWVLILERKPQRFGTQWLWDESKEPFLPTVEDFAHVNERRAKYDIEPLRWPKMGYWHVTSVRKERAVKQMGRLAFMLPIFDKKSLKRAFLTTLTD